MTEGVYYLATPYSKYPGGPSEAYEMACRAAAECFAQGFLVFSPIVHCHPIAKLGNMGGGYDVWRRFAETMMMAAIGLIVVKMAGWEESTGISAEIDWCRRNGKPIFYAESNGRLTL